MKIIKTVFKPICAVLSAVALFISAIPGLFAGTGRAVFTVDASSLGDELPNVVDNVNVWDMGTQFYNAKNNTENDIFEFVRYVQLMQCTGGTPERDLFKDPYDTSVLDDYDFTRLIENCRGILALGAKPHLKLGGVPVKFTSDYEYGGFGMNVYPPDNYNVYYNYIKAIASALVDEFSRDEVLSWRFGCMTEYENGDWFMAKGGDPQASAEAFCKLYDYTVQALVDVLGDNAFVGAHSMTVTEGLWDERIFIEHAAKGVNYANGGTGTHISFLSASFYDSKPGEYTSGKTLPETIAFIKNCAEENGLNDLIYGVDEGRLLCGNSAGTDDNQLLSRTVGYTWQAAYDARIFSQMINAGGNYFSSWDFLSGGLFEGVPTVSYHVASNISRFAGSRRADTRVTAVKPGFGIDVDCLAGWDESSGALRLMAYNFKNDVDYSKSMNCGFRINVPQLEGKTVTVTEYLVNDDCNFFDEWCADRVKYNITDDCFSWSPDDPVLESKTTLSAEWARELYFIRLRDGYVKSAGLIPVTRTAEVKDGVLALEYTLGASNVLFLEIK